MKIPIRAIAVLVLCCLPRFASAQVADSPTRSLPDGSSGPAASERAALAAAADDRLLQQRAASALLAEPVGCSDGRVLTAEQGRHAELAGLRADDISNHDVMVVLVTTGVVVLIALLL